MKILLLGASGMLGSECKNVLNEDHEVIAPGRKELDIISWDVVIEKMLKHSPEIVLNCAGFTDVDTCERMDYFDIRKLLQILSIHPQLHGLVIVVQIG